MSVSQEGENVEELMQRLFIEIISSNVEHTPLPWKYCGYDNAGCDVYEDGPPPHQRSKIADTIRRGDAVFIVRACNAYYKMAQALLSVKCYGSHGTAASGVSVAAMIDEAIEYLQTNHQGEDKVMLPMAVYSDAEYRLFQWFSMDDLVPYAEPDDLYRMLVQKAFLNAECGIYADALRSAAKAINNGKPERLTPEFDRLITQHISDATSGE